MKFNPEDGNNFGPHCRNCHKGSSACGTCHSYNDVVASNVGTGTSTPPKWVDEKTLQITANFGGGSGGSVWEWNGSAYANPVKGGGYSAGATSEAIAADSTTEKTTYDVVHTSDGQGNSIAGTYAASSYGFIKRSREAGWVSDWRSSTAAIPMGKKMTNISGANADCSDDGVSWPHRTLGWKMLKDDLFGIDLAGNVIEAGEFRAAGSLEETTTSTGNYAAHDIDSVCLDCHNPTVWNASTAANQGVNGASHTDDANDPNDNYDDELLLRGLP